MKKIFHKIHLWLSIPLGLIIFVICLSGAILVFQTEINELTNPGRYFVEEVAEKPLPIDELVTKTNSQLIDRTVSSVQVPSDLKRNYVMSLSGEGRASAYVNPYTGELKGTTQRGEGFFSVMLQLHRWLLSRDIGKPIVGYTTLVFVFILITGIIIWWPKGKKQLKHRLQIKTKNGWKRFWYDLHITGGMYVLIGLLVLSLTGLTYSFRWYSKAFYGAFGIEVAERGHGGGGGAPQKDGNQNRGRQGRSERNNAEKPEIPPVEEKKDDAQDAQKDSQEKSSKKDNAPVPEDGRKDRGYSEKIQPDNTNINDSIIPQQREHKRRGNRPQQADNEGANSMPSYRERRGGRNRGQESQPTDTNASDSVVQTQGERRKGNRQQQPEATIGEPSQPKTAQDTHKAINRDNSKRGNRPHQVPDSLTESLTVVEDGNRDNKPSRQKQMNMSQWQAVFNKLKADNPDFRNISISDGSATVAQTFTFGNVRASDKYKFDSQTGEITSVQLYKDQDKSVKARGWVYSLHVGAWGGLFSKILTCIVALIGASLPITGYYLFYIKRKNKRKKNK